VTINFDDFKIVHLLVINLTISSSFSCAYSWLTAER